MDLKDLSLNFEDKTIDNVFLKDTDLIIQKVILSLQCWTGDWFLDGDQGIQYSSRLKSKSLLISDIKDCIMSVDGVKSVENVSVNITYADMNNKRQKQFEITATLILNTSEQVIFNNTVPIVGV